jgi:hypothetical protein
MEPVKSPSDTFNRGNSKSFISINRNNAVNERKSYAQVVNEGNGVTDRIIHKSMPSSNYSNRREIWVPKKAKS